MKTWVKLAVLCSFTLPALAFLSFGAGPVAPPQDPAPEVACPSCDDLNFCTIDSCDATTGTCRHDPRDCRDSNPCTTDTCSYFEGSFAFGSCVHTAVPTFTDCNDGNPCTTGDLCRSVGNAFTCIGTPIPSGYACDDGNACTVSETCNDARECVGTALAPGSVCDDQNLCTSGDTCVASPSGLPVCQAVVQDCNDGNPCTADSCDPATGQCGHPTVDCNDGNSCTADSCDPATGSCVRTFVTGSCDDGNFCTVGESCSSGNCLGGTAYPCNDQVGCTQDFCSPFSQSCNHVIDRSLCPPDGICYRVSCEPSFGGCKVTNLSASPAECDGNPCTLDQCIRGFCQSPIAYTTSPCDDHNVCTTGDLCSLGHCIGTSPCADTNPCTTETCDPVTATCGVVNNNAPCNDGNPCTAGDVCADGTCQSGAPLNCDDANACTADVCGGTGCSHTDISASCNDDDVCTIDSCDPAVGCAHQPVTSRTTCGVGACQRTVDDCLDGVPQTCVPGAPTTELCNGIDDDCDGLMDENRVLADCTISPSTFNLSSQGSSFSVTCKLYDVCGPGDPVPISGSEVSQVYVSRVDSADDPGDDVTLPDPATLPCPDPVLGSLYERGISENLAARDVSNANVTFKFTQPSDGDCSTLDGDRRDLAGRMTAIPDNTSVTICISGKTGGADFQACMLVLVKNKGLR